MIFFRRRPATLTFLQAWLGHLLDANRMYVDLGGGNRAIVGDQLALNTLMTAGSLPWQSVSSKADWRVVWAHNKTLQVRAHALEAHLLRLHLATWVIVGTGRSSAAMVTLTAHDAVQLMPLPTLMFSGGHSYFIQHQAERYNATPFYAHACLVPGHLPAKVARFKEHGLWAIEDEEYYERGNFLFYENTVRPFVAMLEAKARRV